MPPTLIREKIQEKSSALMNALAIVLMFGIISSIAAYVVVRINYSNYGRAWRQPITSNVNDAAAKR